MTTVIRSTDVLPVLRAAVEEKGPEYKYEKPEGSNICLYVHTTLPEDVECPNESDYDKGTDPVPGCLVGDYLVRSGLVTIETLLKAQAREKGDSTDMISCLANDFGLDAEFTPMAKDMLREAQSDQDRGATWGVAVDTCTDTGRQYDENENRIYED